MSVHWDLKAFLFSSLHISKASRALEITITIKLGNKDRLDKKQTGVKERFTEYQPFNVLDLLLK